MERLIVATNSAEVSRDTLSGYDATFVTAPRFAFFRNDAHYAAADEVFKNRWAMLRAALVLPSATEARQALVESPALDFIDRPRALEFWDALIQTDLLVVHGGGILTSATRSRLWEQALTVELAKRRGKRVLLRSHQLGPFVDDADKDRMRTILTHAAYLTTRDLEQSSREVELLSGELKARDQVDDAVIVRMDTPPQPILRRYNLTPRSYICVGYRDNPGVGVGAHVLNRTAEIVQRAHDIFRLPVALLPQGPFDIDALKRLAGMVQAPCQVILPEDQFRDPMVIAAQARLMIACPHHSLIFALRGGVPILSPAAGDYYLFKNHGSMRFFGVEDYVFDIEKPDYLDVASNKLLSILVGGFSLQRRIAFRVNELRSQAAANDLDFGRLLPGN